MNNSGYIDVANYFRSNVTTDSPLQMQAKTFQGVMWATGNYTSLSPMRWGDLNVLNMDPQRRYENRLMWTGNEFLLNCIFDRSDCWRLENANRITLTDGDDCFTIGVASDVFNFTTGRSELNPD